MFCSTHARVAFLFAALILAPSLNLLRAQDTVQPEKTTIQLSWGERRGVSLYRLQLARDRGFADMVFDRLVSGNKAEVKDLAPGRYFWRVAPLTTKLGAYSPALPVEVRSALRSPVLPSPTPTPRPANAIVPEGGWRTAIGKVTNPILARLRSPERPDVVASNSDGLVFGLDATSGVALWSARTPGPRVPRAASFTLTVPTRSSLDNLVVFSGTAAMAIEGSTGRELWRSTLPAAASTGAVITDRTGSRLIILDQARQSLFMLSDVQGSIVSQMNLAGRAVGAPAALTYLGRPAFVIAFDNGNVEIRDFNSAILRAVNVGSAATTTPLFMKGRQGDLLFLGTKDGLNAITAEDLRPLGRVALKDDAPRGTLFAQDLDADGVSEVIMLTERRHLIAINASDGKIRWDVAAQGYGEVLAFADINRDHLTDIFVSGGQRFALALSGRDGSVIWKDDEPAGVATNQVPAYESRSLVAVPYGSGILLIAGDPNGTGLRALSFRSPEIRPNAR